MSEDFEKWFSKELIVKPKLWLLQDKQTLKIGWNAATEAMQAKLDAQAAELAALRRFANEVIDNWNSMIDEVGHKAKYVLIDADGNPKPLLTGEVNE